MRDDDDNEIIEPGDYDLGEGQTLHVWIRRSDYVDPSMWACTAYDHGPLCRRCQEVDGTTNACLLAVIDGMMKIRQNPDTAEFEFSVTTAGEDRVRNLIRELGDEDGLGEDQVSS